MKRKLTLAMLLSLSAASPLALGLGLGEADVRSTLNAPLRASIPLTDTGGMPAGLLNVSVADERAYSAAGLARTPLAAGVRLTVEQREGRLVLVLTTERPVREPWLDLLLRFDWPDGQQLREVTLLLDPPDYDQMPALITPARPAAPSVAAASPGRESAATPRPVVRPAAARAGSDDPAWVRSGDTLWSVAGRLRPDSGISMNQMMVALVEANPEVFPSGNINAMRAGFTLVVPGRDAIAARFAGDADRVVQAMNQAWANRGSGAPARVPLGGSEETSSEAAVAAAGTAEPPAQDEPAAATEGEEAGPAAPPVDGEEGPRLTLLTDAEVAAEAARAADPVEGGADEAGAATPGGERVVIDPTVLQALQGGGDLSSDERLLRLETRWLESQQSLAAIRNERDELQEALGEMREELAALRDQLAALSPGGQGVDGPGTGGVVPPGESGRPAEAPWWSALYRGVLDRSLMLGGAALAALLALWALVRRRRRDETVPTFGQVRTVAPGGGVVGSTVGAPASADAGGTAPVRASMPQAEAINEADIFIAYGRYDQARELLEASLEREPERDDLRLKLLMVHLEQGDHEKAGREAMRLRAGGDPAVLAEVDSLMSRHPAPPDASAAPAGGDRAVFAAPAELPPRRFDAPDEEQPPSAPVPGGEPPERVADDAAEPEGGEDPAARYRRPEPEPALEPEPESASEPESAVRPPRASPEAARPEASEDEPPSAPEPPPAPTLSRRADELGRDIIDYRPPTLDPSPTPREETPMQPSVEFSPAAPGSPPDEEPKMPGDERRGPAGAPDDWEVEEVAFPPLDRDNEWLSAGASSASRLAEARRLLDAGERDRARPLLHELVDAADEPSAREEARELITRHDL